MEGTGAGAGICGAEVEIEIGISEALAGALEAGMCVGGGKCVGYPGVVGCAEEMEGRRSVYCGIAYMYGS